ncbi:transposase [Bacillus sp. SD088]|uniref:transposase n=1 Tax=Bacillus sp. SD088 TaxID=2782012 RepID=UPI001F60F5F7|nr:transposase [Bacillus sp. SD088]
MIIILAASIIFPTLMLNLKNKSKTIQIVFNAIALLSAIIFGDIAALAIRQILIDNTVFMTAIHSVFLNPLFLITGGYIGLFAIYRLLILTLSER